MEKAENENDSSKLFELHWIEPDQTNTDLLETGFERLKRKFLKNPFVPFGMLFTAMILAGGLREFYRGNFVKSQRMMRYRVGMQGLTVFFLVAGLGYENYKSNVQTNQS